MAGKKKRNAALSKFGDETSRQSVVQANRKRRQEIEDLFGYRPINPPSPEPLRAAEPTLDAANARRYDDPGPQYAPYHIEEGPSDLEAYHNIRGQRALPALNFPPPSSEASAQTPPVPPPHRQVSSYPVPEVSRPELLFLADPRLTAHEKIEAFLKWDGRSLKQLADDFASRVLAQDHSSGPTRNSFLQSSIAERNGARERVRSQVLGPRPQPSQSLYNRRRPAPLNLIEPSRSLSFSGYLPQRRLNYPGRDSRIEEANDKVQDTSKNLTPIQDDFPRRIGKSDAKVKDTSNVLTPTQDDFPRRISPFGGSIRPEDNWIWDAIDQDEAGTSSAFGKMSTSMSPSSSPRLPSPPPIPEVQIGPKSPGLDPTTVSAPVNVDSPKISNGSPDRVRPGTKAAVMAAGPPLIPLDEVCLDSSPLPCYNAYTLFRLTLLLLSKPSLSPSGRTTRKPLLLTWPAQSHAKPRKSSQAPRMASTAPFGSTSSAVSSS